MLNLGTLKKKITFITIAFYLLVFAFARLRERVIVAQSTTFVIKKAREAS